MNQNNIQALRSIIKLIAVKLEKCNGDKHEIEKECNELIEFINKYEQKTVLTDELIKTIKQIGESLSDEYMGKRLNSNTIMRILDNHIVRRYEEIYDKSRIANPQLLSTMITEKGDKIKAVRFIPMETESMIYASKNVKIQSMGKLYFKHANALTDYINKYRITRDNKFYEVYTSIIVLDMQKDELYRRAVEDVLLGKENLELSNCEGYIGFIDKINPDIDNEYNINEKYCLAVDSVEATAVSEYSKLQTKEMLEKRETEGR